MTCTAASRAAFKSWYPYDAFYGMREFIIRDCNGFWITFGQPIQT